MTRCPPRNLLWPLVVLCWVVAAPRAEAQEGDPPRIAAVKLGFDGAYKLGCWTPVEVSLAGGAEPIVGRVMLTVPDGDGIPTSVFSSADRPLSLEPGEITTARLFVRIGRAQAPLKVTLLVADKPLVERSFYVGNEADEGTINAGLPTTNRWLLQFGPSLGLSDLVRESQGAGDLAGTHITRIEDAADLPSRWIGYEGVDTIYLTTSQADLYRPLEQSPARVEALREWVERGGRLVFFCGQSADELLRPGGVLAGIAPGNFDSMVPLRQSLPIESFAGSDEPITRTRRLDLRVPRLTEVSGLVLAHGGQKIDDLPLVIRARLGFGEVVFIGLDFDAQPLRDWSGRAAFLRKALDWPSPDAVNEQTPSSLGYDSDDMIGKLRHALDDKFEGVTTVSFALVATLVVGYILLIGPGDYFFVKKVLRRMELTWITFPLTVVAVSAAAYWLANWMKGDELRVNQVEIVNVDAVAGRACGTVWTHFFTPRVDQYDLSFQPHFLGGGPLAGSREVVAWLGLPGYGAGGMQGAGGQPSLFASGYTFDDQLTAMRGVPVELWSTKTITARWAADVTPALQSQLQRAGEELLEGQVVNDTGQVLEDCLVLHGSWAYYLGRLEPSAVKQINSELQPRTVKTMLTSATAGDQTESRTADDGTVPFRLAEDDVARLVKAMMFFHAINGERYSGVLNRYQANVDLSHILRQPDTAILLARTTGPGSQWLTGAGPLASPKDHRWTYYRFLLPVSEKEAN